MAESRRDTEEQRFLGDEQTSPLPLVPPLFLLLPSQDPGRSFRGRFFGKQADEQGRKGDQEGRRRLILRGRVVTEQKLHLSLLFPVEKRDQAEKRQSANVVLFL